MNNIETAIDVLTSSYGVKVLAVVAASAAVAIYKFGTNIVTTIAAAIAAIATAIGAGMLLGGDDRDHHDFVEE